MNTACEKKILDRKRLQRLPADRRAEGLHAVEPGLTSKEAIEEAQRCLGSQSCEACDVCGLLCPDLCVTRDEVTGTIRIDLDYCKGCGICAAVCPKQAIVMEREA